MSDETTFNRNIICWYIDNNRGIEMYVQLINMLRCECSGKAEALPYAVNTLEYVLTKYGASVDVLEFTLEEIAEDSPFRSIITHHLEQARLAEGL